MSDRKGIDFDLFSDEPLGSESNLDFGVEHVIATLRHITLTCPTPYHIGLFAPWGSGKSTVLEGLAGASSERIPRVHVVTINAWKYRHDSLRRRFLLSVAKKLNPEMGKSLRKRMYTILTGLSDPKDWDWKLLRDPIWRDRLCKRLKTPLNISYFVFLTIFVIGFIQAFAEARGHILNLDFLWAWLVKAASLLGAPVIAFFATTLVTAIGSIRIDNEPNEQVTNQEQFEELFHEALGAIGDLERVLIVVDELDRCSPEQVLEALETVKTFMNAPKCVFVLACDRDIIERALETTLMPNGGRVKSYLDKIFQLTVHLPPVQVSDMYLYARRLLESNVSKVSPILATSLTESRCLDVLIRPDVTTPRKVKRLLNDFLVRYSLATRRESGWEAGSLTQDLPFLAKMTVLATEFPDFYHLLASNAELMSWLDELRRGQLDSLEPYQLDICRQFFIADGDETDWSSPRPEHEALIRFLGQTWQFEGDGEKVLRHIHLARDPEGVHVGDSQLRMILDAAQAAQVKQLERFVAEAKEPDSVLRLIASRVHLARGTVQMNLLLSLLHLAKYAELGRDGTKVAAGILGVHYDTLGGSEVWKTASPIQALAYVPSMPSSAAAKWLVRMTTWVRESLPERGKQYFDHTKELASLPAMADKTHADLVWDYLQTPSGRTHFVSCLPHFAGHPRLRGWLRSVFPRFRHWFGPDSKGKRTTNTDDQIATYRQWITTLGAMELAKTLGNEFWSTLDSLFYPHPSADRDWLLPITIELQNEIPEGCASGLLFGVVYAQDESTTPQQWTQVLQLTNHLLSRYGQAAVSKEKDLLSALTDGFTVAGVSPIADVASRYWGVWSVSQRNYFHSELVSQLTDETSHETLLEVTEALRNTTEGLAEETQTKYFAGLQEIVSANGTDEQVMKTITSLLTSHRPFPIPPTSKTGLVKALRDIAFASDQETGQVHALSCLSQVYSDLVPGDEGAFVEDVVDNYISGEKDSERFEAGCSAAKRYMARLVKWPGVAQALFDALVLHAGDSKRGKTAADAVHTLLRLLSTEVIDSRSKQIEDFLVSHSSLDNALRTLSVLAEREDKINFVDVVLEYASYVEESKLGLIVDWTLAHPDQAPLGDIMANIVHFEGLAPFVGYLADSGGIETRASLAKSFCEMVRSNPTSAAGLELLAAVARVRDKRVSTHTVELVIHMLTGTKDQQERILEHIPQIASLSVLTHSEANKIRDHLLTCYENGDDPRKALAARCLKESGLLNRKARATIEGALPENSEARSHIEESLRK